MQTGEIAILPAIKLLPSGGSVPPLDKVSIPMDRLAIPAGGSAMRLASRVPVFDIPSTPAGIGQILPGNLVVPRGEIAPPAVDRRARTPDCTRRMGNRVRGMAKVSKSWTFGFSNMTIGMNRTTVGVTDLHHVIMRESVSTACMPVGASGSAILAGLVKNSIETTVRYRRELGAIAPASSEAILIDLFWPEVRRAAL
jgi:hypothetical protein